MGNDKDGGDEVKLIQNWRQCYKFWSTRLQIAGVFILGALQEFPDAVAQIYMVIPSDIRATLPDDTLRWIGYGCLTAGIIARIIYQPKLHAGVGGKGKP